VKIFTHRHSLRDAVAIGSVAVALILLTTVIDNDVLAVAIGVVAVVGALVALWVTRKPIDHQEKT
jgi:membrane protein YdbS with pleckstrin-like domain